MLARLGGSDLKEIMLVSVMRVFSFPSSSNSAGLRETDQLGEEREVCQHSLFVLDLSIVKSSYMLSLLL